MAIKTITCKKTFKTPSFDQLTQINITIKKGDVIEISDTWYLDVYELVSINGNREHKFLLKNLGGGGNTVTPMFEICDDEMGTHFEKEIRTFNEFLNVYSKLHKDSASNSHEIQLLEEEYPQYTKRYQEMCENAEIMRITDTVFI